MVHGRTCWLSQQLDPILLPTEPILLWAAQSWVGLGIWLKVTNNFSFFWKVELDMAILVNDC